MEIWKGIIGFEDSHCISNFGNLKSLDRVITYKNGRSRLFLGCLLKPSISTHGYKYFTFQRNKRKIKRVFIHRLVAETFIENPTNLPIINHIDGNKLNNFVDNLEWCDYQHNQTHAMKLGLFIPHTQKINYNIADKIRCEYANSNISQKKLGELYGLARTNINKIINNKCWIIK